jgi:PEP-CTERM motif
MRKVLLAAAGTLALMASMASANAATTVLNFSEQGRGMTVVSTPADDLATATSVSTKTWEFPDTFTLLSPFTGTVTSFTLTNPENLSATGGTNLGTNVLTIVVGGVTYTDDLTQTLNTFGQVEEVGLLKGGTLPAAGLASSLNLSYTQSGGKGKGISGSATFIAYAPVPEPATWAMLLLGFTGLGYTAFRRSAKNRMFAAI